MRKWRNVIVLALLLTVVACKPHSTSPEPVVDQGGNVVGKLVGEPDIAPTDTENTDSDVYGTD